MRSNQTSGTDLGVPFDGVTGPVNAITDVKGVEVGHTTLISGDATVTDGRRAGANGRNRDSTPRKDANDPALARWFTENGNGEMTGTTWVEESGFLEGPVMITNTHSVGIVRDAVIGWRLKHRGPDKEGYAWSLPIVAIPKAFFATNPMEEPISSRILTTKTGSPASAAGGHRFWVSPEVERMYYAYNTPVAVSLRNGRKP